MKLRLFHRNKPVACIELTPEGELTDINMQAFKALRLGGGIFRIR